MSTYSSTSNPSSSCCCSHSLRGLLTLYSALPWGFVCTCPIFQCSITLTVVLRCDSEIRIEVTQNVKRPRCKLLLVADVVLHWILWSVSGKYDVWCDTVVFVFFRQVMSAFSNWYGHREPAIERGTTDQISFARRKKQCHKFPWRHVIATMPHIQAPHPCSSFYLSGLHCKSSSPTRVVSDPVNQRCALWSCHPMIIKVTII